MPFSGETAPLIKPLAKITEKYYLWAGKFLDIAGYCGYNEPL